MFLNHETMIVIGTYDRSPPLLVEIALGLQQIKRTGDGGDGRPRTSNRAAWSGLWCNFIYAVFVSSAATTRFRFPHCTGCISDFHVVALEHKILRCGTP